MMKPGLVTAFAVLLALLPWKANATDFPALFDTVAYHQPAMEALPGWRHLLRDTGLERARYDRCLAPGQSCPSRAALAWRAVIEGEAGQSPLAKARAVNLFINELTGRADGLGWQRPDDWVSPLAFLRLSGTSEDVAVMKYVSLRAVGIPAENLRIVVVRDLLRDKRHTILAARLDDHVYILDHLYQAVLPQHRVRQYTPQYSLNEAAGWTHLPKGGKAVPKLIAAAKPTSAGSS